MKYANWTILLLFFLFPNLSHAQEDNEPDWVFKGYVKSLQGYLNLDFPGLPNNSITDNFIHHRLNVNWYPTEKISFQAGLRTRLFFGELSRLTPGYGDLLSDSGNDVVNLAIINTGKDVLLHSILDRAFLDYTNDNLEIRLGRQRINWGINTIWNPNDLFNAYAFTDFDYEERPGTDAFRIRYFIGFAGSIEFAVKAFDNTDEIVAAAMYKWNTNNYDIQLLGGWSEQDIVIGGGWAGNLGDVGFKGEWSWFWSTNETLDNNFEIALSGDYSFQNGFFLVGGMLFNHLGSNEATSSILNFNLSARNIYPFKWTAFIQAAYPISPLLNAALALIYSPVQDHPVFLSPSLTYSLASNMDVDLVSQIVLQDAQAGYGSETSIFYLRVKWSY